MDYTNLSTIQAELTPNDSGISHKLPANIEHCALEEQIDDSQFDDNPMFLSTPSSNSVHPIGQSSLAAKAKNKHLPYDYSCIVTEEDEDLSIGSPDASSVGESAGFGKEGVYRASVSSATGRLSDLSSESGDETFESLNQYLKPLRSDFEPYGVREPIDNELDKSSMSIPDLQDEWSSENESNTSGKETNALVVVPWISKAVDSSDIASHGNTPPASDITDLGDRGFYANLGSTRRRSFALFNFDDNYEHLALRERFSEVRVRVDNGKGFFPRALLAGLVTEECVYDQLKLARCLGNEHTTDQIQAYAKTICEERLIYSEDDSKPPRTKSFKKIFTILVMIEETSSIVKFLEEDVNDLDLPLKNHPWGRNNSLYDLRRGGTDTKKLECFRHWTQFKTEAFYDWQWTTISPFFHKGLRKDVKHFPLHDSVILPFTPGGSQQNGSESRAEIKGGFGHVFQVVIHPDHHNFNLPKNRDFAIKRLNSPKEEDFRKEVEMLKLFSDNAHPHLISLLATYEYRRAYYLIFPWADGDLDDFWVVHRPKPPFDMKTFRWVAKQCEGISSGLTKIHNYEISNSKCQPGFFEKRYGRHGDLTPRNILWFNDADGGTLKISDFGLSEYSTTHSKSRSGVATTMSYRPPESDIKGGKISQSSDIWTLGCLYLEFVTWLLGGIKLVDEFAAKRKKFDRMWYMDSLTFFELEEFPNSNRLLGLKATVKPAVKTFIIHDLHGHPNCTEFLHDFLNLIEFDMLIIKSNDREDKARITSEQLHARLATILAKCDDQDYLSKPACWNGCLQPWTRRSQTSEVAVEVNPTESARESLYRENFPLLEGPIQERPQPKFLTIPGRRRLSSHN